MDFLFNLFTPRKVVLFLVLLLMMAAARRYGPQFQAWYLAKLYPAIGGPSAAGKDISDQWESQQARHVVLEYQRICALLAAAQEKGFRVDGLKAEADTALTLNTPAYRRQALQILSKVEFSIPQQ